MDPFFDDHVIVASFRALLHNCFLWHHFDHGHVITPFPCIDVRMHYVIFISHLASFNCFNPRARGCYNNALGYVMRSPSARALRNREHYCMFRVHQY